MLNNNNKTCLIRSIEELDEAVIRLLQSTKDRKVIVFSGEIGSGKTTFIQAFCRHFNVSEQVVSPTFSLANEYTYIDPETGQTRFIYHLDLYRLKNIQEAIDIGIEDYLYSGHFCLIEWPEVIEPLLPEDVIRIKMEIVGNSTRKILFL